MCHQCTIIILSASWDALSKMRSKNCTFNKNSACIWMKKRFKILNIVIEITNYVSRHIPKIFSWNRLFESQMDEFNDEKMLRSSGEETETAIDRWYETKHSFVPHIWFCCFSNHSGLCLLVKKKHLKNHTQQIWIIAFALCWCSSLANVNDSD